MQRDRNQHGQFVKRQTGDQFEGFAVWLDRKGYPCIWLQNRSVKVHIFVWERANGPKPQGYDIHHKDYDKSNYALDNLELLSHSDHQRIHAGWQREQGDWIAKPCSRCKVVLPLSEFYPRKGYTPTAQCRPCHNVSSAENVTRNFEMVKRRKHEWYLRRKQQNKGVMPSVGE